jgi:hypothetical protein
MEAKREERPAVECASYDTVHWDNKDEIAYQDVVFMAEVGRRYGSFDGQ